MDRRSFLAALPLVPAAARSASVRAFGARGDGHTDDSAAFQAALDRSRSIWVPAGRYLVGELAIWSHTRIQGEGARSVLLHKKGSAVLASAQAGDGGSPDPRDNVRDIAIEDLAFEGRSVSEGFFETHHLLVVAGCSRLTVARCRFSAFQGDAIILCSGYSGAVERHNEDIAIRHCLFDGVNFANRQAVSVVEGTRVAIERNRFQNCSRHDMPGAVDIELELAHARIRDIRVAGNHFVNVLGGVGVVSVILAIDRSDAPPHGIEIRGNRIEGRYKSPGIVAKAFVDGASAPPIGLVIAGNEILDTHHGFEVSGLNGVRVEDNLIRGTVVHATLSTPHRGRAANVTVTGNRFEKVGMHGPTALKVHPTVGLVIARNRFVDCGWSQEPRAILDVSEEPAGEMRLESNDFAEPRRRSGA